MRGEQAEHLLRTGAWVDPASLEHDSHPGVQGGRVASGIEAEHPHVTRVRVSETLAYLDRGGLAGTVRAEQCRHRTCSHAQ